MLKQIAVVFILFSLIQPVTNAKDLFSLIKNGNLREAQDSLSRYSSAGSRDGRIVFCQALIETNGKSSARALEAALNASVPVRYQEEIYLRLAEIYLLEQNHRRLTELVAEYSARWEDGRYYARMLRISALLNEQNSEIDVAIRKSDRLIVRSDNTESGQQAKLDKARLMLASRRKRGSEVVLRDLSRSKSDIVVPQSLYLLGCQSARTKKIDDAVFYYNLLREGYPDAVGLDSIVDLLSGMSSSSTMDNRADDITGTYYSIQVGVFSSRSNAKKQSNIFKAYKKKRDIGSKTISGKKYHVVYIGKFGTFEEAKAFKLTLEKTHAEAYQVVAR